MITSTMNVTRLRRTSLRPVHGCRIGARPYFGRDMLAVPRGKNRPSTPCCYCCCPRAGILDVLLYECVCGCYNLRLPLCCADVLHCASFCCYCRSLLSFGLRVRACFYCTHTRLPALARGVRTTLSVLFSAAAAAAAAACYVSANCFVWC